MAVLAATPAPPDYSQGVRWFPRFWRAYQLHHVPAPDLSNGTQLQQLIHDGKLELSVAQLLTLVAENNLDVVSARYNVRIAETDILRARSGQAARGVSGVPLPSELFATAVGAGVGGAGNVFGAGTGPAAITAAARQVVIGPRGTFDPDLQFNFSFDRASSPLNTVRVAGVPTVITPSTVALTQYEQSFPTGTSFSVSFNLQRQSSTQQFLLFNPAYAGRMSVVFNQQLLNGFGLAVNRRFLNTAQNDREISREQFRQALDAALANAQSAYWDLAAARENVRVAEQSLAVAQQLYEDNQKQLEAGTMSELDVVQARSEVAGNRRDLIVAQTNFQIQELQVKDLISKSLAGLGPVQLVPTDRPPEPQNADIPSLQEALKTAVRNRPELRQADGNIQNLEIARKFTHNSLKPVLSVFGLFASSGLVSSLGPAFQQVWQQVPYPEYAIGFSLSVPILNRSAQADNARAQIELRQAETSRRRSEDQVGLDVRTAIVGLIQSKAQLEAARKVVESSKEALDAEKTRLGLGVSTAYRVIQFERDFVSAQFQEVQAHANYAKALVQLDHVMGMTLEKSNISLDEALRGAP